MKEAKTPPHTLIERIESRVLEDPLAAIELSDDEIDSLKDEDIAALMRHYGSTTLLRLPPRERAFFDWVKKEDPAVWNDLWAEDDGLLVAISHLAALQAGGPGFLICELVTTPNYFFTPRHIKPDGLEALPGILDRIRSGSELSVGETLMFEIVSGPIDIWHFCHKYGVSLQRGKSVVADLSAHDWIVHLPSREDIIPYID